MFGSALILILQKPGTGRRSADETGISNMEYAMILLFSFPLFRDKITQKAGKNLE